MTTFLLLMTLCRLCNDSNPRNSERRKCTRAVERTCERLLVKLSVVNARMRNE